MALFTDRISTLAEETNTAAVSQNIRYYLKYCHLELIYRVWNTEKGIVCRVKGTQQNQIEFQCILRRFEIFFLLLLFYFSLPRIASSILA